MPQFRTFVPRKGSAMLIVLLSVFLFAAAIRAARVLYRLWKAVPRSNLDFGLY